MSVLLDDPPLTTDEPPQRLVKKLLQQDEGLTILPAVAMKALQLANDPERDRENKALYLVTNDVAAGAGFAGADASASWWRRNFRMYANVQRAAAPGRRVLVVAGQGHTAILKDLLAIDGGREAEDVAPYLPEAGAVAR